MWVMCQIIALHSGDLEFSHLMKILLCLAKKQSGTKLSVNQCVVSCAKLTGCCSSYIFTVRLEVQY